MARKKGSPASLTAELISKSKEAALAAIRIYNDPGNQFKSETYIVLMVIAWTYLLHAYFRQKRIDYRYSRAVGKRKRFERTKRGAYRYWELERCLTDSSCPIDKDASNNLKFLIGLRHEIEHQMTRSLDSYLSGRYQACAMNFNAYLKKLFGAKHGLDQHLSYSIQFLQLASEQLLHPIPEPDIPDRLRTYVREFDDALTHDEYNSERYSYRLLFKRKLVNKPGQADRVIEFIDPASDIAKEIDKEYWVQKDVEKPKYKPINVVEAVRAAGFAKFRVQPEHLAMWKAEDAKNPAKGYGVLVQGSWYWYQSWIDRCIALCKTAGDKYRAQGPA
jgi:hypothetical protein